MHPLQQRSKPGDASSLIQLKVIESPPSLRFLGVHINKMLTNNSQVRTTKLRSRRRRPSLKAMAGQGQWTVSVVSECETRSHILWSLSHNPFAVQSAEAGQDEKQSHENHSGTTKDTPIEAMLCSLSMPSAVTRQKVEQIKTLLSGKQNPKNPLHHDVKGEMGVDRHFVDRPNRTTKPACVQSPVAHANKKQKNDPKS